jgi:tetratricopeptide (TPR) repeat protein
MRNRLRPSGVYTNMLRVPLFLVCSLAALAQPSPRQDPLEVAIQAVWQARNSGHFEEAVAAREQARAVLPRAPVDSPQFPGWAQQVAQLYQNANWNAQARAILRDALDRTRPLGDSHPSRIALLTALSDAWRQDGNLLKAAGYLEQAAAAQPATLGAVFTYTNLAGLYRQLGRPDAVAAIAVKIRALASNDPAALARFYEQQGQLAEAADIYRKLADQSADPQARSNALQSLANLYARQERYTDAVATERQAIAAMPSPDYSWMLRQKVAVYLRHAGEVDQADQIFGQLLRENTGASWESWLMASYAQHLAETNRAAQAEDLLNDYLAGHPNLNGQQRVNILLNLANLAQRTGDSKRATEYQSMWPFPPPSAAQTLMAEATRKVQEAVTQHRWSDAYHLALHAIDAAAQAPDWDQVAWTVPQIAQELAANKEPAKAESLFQRLLALAQNRKADTIQPLVTATRNYVEFLMNQPDRLREVPAAIDQYRGVLTDANGPDSASLAGPLHLAIDLAVSQSQWERAAASARELLELQESLSGNTSEAYLSDLQTAAGVYEADGGSLRALPLFRQAVTIADLLATSNKDRRRARTRMDVALVLARLDRFDEAVTLGEEAVALDQPPRAPEPPLTQLLEQIRQMKQAASTVIATRKE